jgi:Flp pilus assembly protein TadD
MPAEDNAMGWILHSHGQGRKFGPLTEDELRSYFRAGMVKSVDRLTAPGSSEKHAAADVAAALGESVPVGPPPPPEVVEAAPMPRTAPVAAAVGAVRDVDANAEERAARAAAAMNIDLAAMMSSSAPAKKGSGWLGPVVIVAVLVLMLLVGLNMLRKLKPQAAAPGPVAVDSVPGAEAKSAVVTPPVAPSVEADARQAPRPIPTAAPVGAAPVDAGMQAKANALKASGDWAGLVAHARSWQQAQPDRTEPLAYLGAAYAGMGNLAQAEDSFKKVLARAPDDHLAQSMLAQVYEQSQRYDEAAILYKQMVTAAPNDAVAWNNYGAALGGANQQAQAVVALENAVRLDPKLKQAWTNLGNLYQAMGDQTKAQAAFANAR